MGAHLRLLAVSALLATLFALGGTARAGEDVEQAKKYFEAGKQAYETSRYPAAISAFEAALELSPRPAIVFSLAQAYRQQYFIDRDPGKLTRALELYRRYVGEVRQGGRLHDAVQHIADLELRLQRLEEENRRAGRAPLRGATLPPVAATQLMVSSRTPGARASIDGQAGTDMPLIGDVQAGKHAVHVEADGFFPEDVEGVAVDGRLIVVEVNLKPKPARVALAAPAGASVTVDGRPYGKAPLAGPLQLPAGKHFLAVSARGRRPFTRELALGRGQEIKLQAPLERTGQRVASYVVFAGAGALALGGGTAASLAYLAQSDAQDIQGRLDAQQQLTSAELAEYNRLLARRDDLRTATYVLTGSAVVIGTTGLLLYLFDSPRIESGAGGPALSPVVAPDSAGFVWTGSF